MEEDLDGPPVSSSIAFLVSSIGTLSLYCSRTPLACQNHLASHCVPFTVGQVWRKRLSPVLCSAFILKGESGKSIWTLHVVLMYNNTAKKRIYFIAEGMWLAPLLLMRASIPHEATSDALKTYSCLSYMLGSEAKNTIVALKLKCGKYISKFNLWNYWYRKSLDSSSCLMGGRTSHTSWMGRKVIQIWV